MIIVRLNGGLGNQMFQYAAARALALRTDQELKLDLEAFGHDPLRSYVLDCFQSIQTRANAEEIRRVRGYGGDRLSRVLYVLGQGPKTYDRRKSYKEQAFTFDAQLLRRSGDTYLEGYWQSEKYFEDHALRIREDFRFREPLLGANADLARKIGGVEAVALHVRRGDYVKDPKTNQMHGTCDLDYYRRAVDRIAAQVAEPVFFLFSDDPAWVRANLKLGHPSVVMEQNQGQKDFEDLRLMSLCKHMITANSSFSWWGAWMIENTSKIVVAPRKWFNDPSKDTRDLIPMGWERV